MGDMNLSELKKGEIAQVIGISTEDRRYRRRLISMGITPGASIEISQFAPLGDPISFSIRGIQLALRKQEAALVSIKK